MTTQEQIAFEKSPEGQKRREMAAKLSKLLKHKIDAGTAREFLDQYLDDGTGYSFLAKKYNLEIHGLRLALDELGIKRDRRRKVPDGIALEIDKRRATGMSMSQIAVELNISKATVQYHVEQKRSREAGAKPLNQTKKKQAKLEVIANMLRNGADKQAIFEFSESQFWHLTEKTLDTYIRQAKKNNAIIDKPAKIKAYSPAGFRRRLRIDANGRTVLFVPEPWQEADFVAMDPAWTEAAGFKVKAPVEKRMAWFERPRGHSKSSDIAAMALWAIYSASKQIKGIAVAASQKQAKILRDFIAKILKLNKWLARWVKAERHRVVNTKTGSNLDILAADAATSYGELVDFVICEEVSHWPQGKETLWEAMLSTKAKRKRCLLIVITNAGFTYTWQWPLRESVRTSPKWHFSRLDAPVASWVGDDLEEQKRLLPPSVYARLWLNVWSEGSGDALGENDIRACTTLAGELAAPEIGWTYYGGIDLSIRRDHSSVCVVGQSPTGRLKLARLQSWAPEGGKLDFAVIASVILNLDRQFSGVEWWFDIYQCEMLNQLLARDGVLMQEANFQGKCAMEMAGFLLEAFHSRLIELYTHPLLKADLLSLKITEAPAGWRLQAPRTTEGHADRATSLCLAILGARRAEGRTIGDIIVGNPDESPFFRQPESPYKESESGGFQEMFSGDNILGDGKLNWGY